MLTINGPVMFSPNPLLNYLKSEVIELYYHCYDYHPSQKLFLCCLQTLAQAQPNLLTDHTDIVVSDVIKILERATGHAPYTQELYSHTQILILKLFQLSVAGASERANLANDPDYFVEIADDFCQTQESESVKVRSGSLLYNLCLSVDGNLTVTFQMALISLLNVERNLSEKFAPQKVRKDAQAAKKDMENLIGLWGGDEESLSEVSILILCCISDLIQKREGSVAMITEHLKAMGDLLRLPEALDLMPPILTARYLMLCSFFSYPKCLDHFLPLYEKHPIFPAAILKALDTIIQFHDRKSEDMRMYVAAITTNTLLLSKTLTPLMEKTIVERPNLVLCVKERVLEKMVGWFIDYYDKENMFGCHKIGNLMGKILDKYPEYMVRGDISIDPMNI